MIDQYIEQYMNRFVPYKGGVWCYEDGILMHALYALYKKTAKREYFDFVKNYYNNMILEDGKIKNYSPEEYNIDNIAPGIALIELYEETREEKYRLAIEELYEQIKHHPRTAEGNFWHKKRYPYQVWLDGIYMGQVFLIKYALLANKQEILSDIDSQLANVRKYLYDEEKGLYLHAYDERKVMQWADKTTGRSPNVWSRSVGWLAMALVEMLSERENEKVRNMFVEMIAGVDRYKHEGMWYQIVDKADVKGNYPETSGTMMLCYAYLKGSRLGFLRSDFFEKGKEIFASTVKRYFYQDETGFHLGGICEVAGLDNERRDGSISYYLSERVKSDEVKGVAPFILAYSELINIE
ncbi:MAG TPA: glycoside hydrolase family 88 protein [Bacilli bacterium]